MESNQVIVGSKLEGVFWKLGVTVANDITDNKGECFI